MQEMKSLSGRVALGIREAAAALGVSEGLIRKWLPELPHTRLGERVLIPVDLLKDWLHKRSQADLKQSENAADEILKALQG